MIQTFDRESERADMISMLARVSPAKRQSLLDEYRRRSEAAFSPKSLKNLRQIIGAFSTWCKENDHRAEPPVEPAVVAEYVEWLGGKLRSSTIETRLWAIAEWHRSQFQASPCRHRLVELALKGVKRTYGVATRQAPALGKRDVHRLVRGLSDDPKSKRDKALIWAASDSWCRVSELVALRVRDFIRQDDGTGLLFIVRSKTDQFGEGDYAFLSEGGSEAVLDWVTHAGLKQDDPIFTKSQKNGQRIPLDPATVSRIFKKRFGRSDVTTHSTRVGGVHDAFRIGCSLSAIMVAGRWKSPEMPAKYGRRILASHSAAAEVARAYSDGILGDGTSDSASP